MGGFQKSLTGFPRFSSGCICTIDVPLQALLCTKLTFDLFAKFTKLTPGLHDSTGSQAAWRVVRRGPPGLSNSPSIRSPGACRPSSFKCADQAPSNVPVPCYPSRESGDLATETLSTFSIPCITRLPHFGPSFSYPVRTVAALFMDFSATRTPNPGIFFGKSS